MRVLYLVNDRPSFFDQQVEALADHGVEPTVLSVPGSRRHRGKRSPSDYLRFYPSVLRGALGEVDLVHAHYGLLGPFGLAQPRPVVLSLWGSELVGGIDRLRRISEFSARFASATVVPTREMRERLPTRAELIPFGIDTELFRPIPKREARERLGWDPAARIVLFPYDTERAVKNYPLARRAVDRLGLDVELRTVSGRPYEEMPLVMNASDALLVTSRYESGPMVVKEAVACDLPVVSTDVGFAREVLRDVSHSYVCEDEDEIVARLAEVFVAGERSDGREVYDPASLEETSEALFSLYERVLSRG